MIRVKVYKDIQHIVYTDCVDDYYYTYSYYRTVIRYINNNQFGIRMNIFEKR